MMAFLDTSSLIKLYHHEDGSDWIMETLSHNQIEDIFLSELAILEFRSALWKKVRVKELEETSAIEVIQCFQNDKDHYEWIALQDDIVVPASKLLMKYGNRGLRTLDSLQLASALSLKEKNGVFLTSDKLLYAENITFS
ncbi:MAG: type II toxin-antitoxin system VapC family toxin [SAR324 cluster bacterium]|nr:type II toxin-antitoxin system VapC family toxin [SAR324 cluster bacterium]